MAGTAENITRLLKELPSEVRLVAVSKTIHVSEILNAYRAGQRCFGENRVQEMITKKENLPEDIEWHLIGHLQTNKVRQIVSFVNMIQSVDSFRLLSVINNEAVKVSRIVDCLFQIHIAEEETKFGFSLRELEGVVGSQEFISLKNVRICGVMGMATFTNDEAQIRKEFRYLADCFESMKNRFFIEVPHFREISMGMSGDYKIAVEEGSTMVRIGSHIFGERST